MKVLNLKVLLSLLVMSFALVACGDDDDTKSKGTDTEDPKDTELPSEAPSVVGNWFYEGTLVVLTDGGVGLLYEVPAESVDELDGTYYDVDQFTYTYNASRKVITQRFADGERYEITVLKLTGSIMMISETDPETGEISTATMTKVPDGKIPTVKVSWN